MNRGGLATVLLALMATVVGAGVFASAWLIGRPVPAEVAPTAREQYVVVGEADFDANRAAVLRVTLDTGETILAPGESGLVTEVAIAPGDRVAAGTRLYAIDGNGVFAYVAETPLYRELGRGAKGPDVAVLQEFLAAWSGTDADVDGQFGASTVALVRDWQTAEGLTVTGRVEPARLARIPRDLTVGEVTLVVGRPGPETGSVILKGTTTVTALAIDGQEPDAPDASGYVFLLDGRRLDLGHDGDSWYAPDPTAVLQLLGPTAAPTGDDASAAFAELREVDLSGRIAWAHSVRVASVPASALVVAGDGSACVWVRGSGEALEPVAGLTVLGTSVSGAAMIDAVDLVGREVALSARASDPCP